MNFNDLCFPKPSKFIKKSTPKSIKKLIDLYIGFWSIFHPFWVPKWVPKWSKIWSKINQKINQIFNAFFIDFGSILASNLGVHWGSGGDLLVVLLGSWGHLGANMAPRALQEALMAWFWSALGAIMEGLGCQLGGFGLPTWWIWAPAGWFPTGWTSQLLASFTVQARWRNGPQGN